MLNSTYLIYISIKFNAFRNNENLSNNYYLLIKKNQYRVIRNILTPRIYPISLFIQHVFL